MSDAHFLQAVEQAKLEALYEFAYGAGHEINNPLATISARAQSLLRDETDPEKCRQLAAIITQAERAHAMIADLMLFARPPKLQLETWPLADVWQTATEDLRQLAMERGIAWQVTKPHEPALVLADRVQLTVAVREIIRNTLELHPLPTLLQFQLMPVQGMHLRIECADNGPGLSPEQRSRIFDPFYSGREAGRGLGFGLCKAWRIITAHGGTITVDSQLGAGTTVVIEI